MRIFLQHKVFLLLLLGAIPLSQTTAQEAQLTNVTQDFNAVYITPNLLRDSTRSLHIEQIRTPEMIPQFRPAESPYLTFGADLSAWWLTFKVNNELKTHKTYILWFLKNDCR